MTRSKHFRKILWTVLTALFVVVVFLLGINVINSRKIILGVSIAGDDYGGKTADEAAKILNEKTAEFLSKKILFELPEKKFRKEISLTDLGINIDVAETVKKASEIGRTSKILFASLGQIKTSLAGKEMSLDYKIDTEKFNRTLEKKMMALVENPARNSTLNWNFQTETFENTSSKSGKIIARTELSLNLVSRIQNLDASPIKLSLVDDSPEVKENETEIARQKAMGILNNGPYVLKNWEREFEISREDLLSFMEFKPIVGNLSGNKILGTRPNYENIKNYVSAFAPTVNKESENAQFEIKNGRVAAFALSSPGKQLNVEKTANDLAANIWGSKKETQIVIDTIFPQITEKNVENLGITDLIGNGISDFSGSPASRVKNIKIGAEKFQGVLIAPAEEFSFNRILGKVTSEAGFATALVIKAGKTVPELGGGICQVSTTLFRAAINAGLEITARTPHSYPVKYYNPQGFDATIYPPYPDLKFKNNTENYILIQSKINGSILTFELYGKNDGRTVAIEGPFEYDKKSDGSLKAKLMQKVYDKDGDLVLEKTFYSNYKSPALYPIRNPLE